uniref:Uncharacterized protein n=1 Tax=Romanomermis culicivorax TaxID=13658 RepID=A0A915KIV1_ROMCU
MEQDPAYRCMFRSLNIHHIFPDLIICRSVQNCINIQVEIWSFKDVTKVGFGLTLVLNVAKKSYPAAIRGAVLTIMDNYTSPGGLTDVLLQAGQWSKIIMDASRYTMLNTNSYSTKQDCFDDEQEKPVYKPTPKPKAKPKPKPKPKDKPKPSIQKCLFFTQNAVISENNHYFALWAIPYLLRNPTKKR